MRAAGLPVRRVNATTVSPTNNADNEAQRDQKPVLASDKQLLYHQPSIRTVLRFHGPPASSIPRCQASLPLENHAELVQDNTAYLPALESAWRVGNTAVVEYLVRNWEKFARQHRLISRNVTSTSA